MLNTFRLFYGISLKKLRLAKLWPELTIVAEATNRAEALSEYQAFEPALCSSIFICTL